MRALAIALFLPVVEVRGFAPPLTLQRSHVSLKKEPSPTSRCSSRRSRVLHRAYSSSSSSSSSRGSGTARAPASLAVAENGTTASTSGEGPTATKERARQNDGEDKHPQQQQQQQQEEEKEKEERGVDSGAEEGGGQWTEVEDWLIQDTYPRYAIGSGKHVLWRRMILDVPELCHYSPEEVRTRWLQLTGRSARSRKRSSGGTDTSSRSTSGSNFPVVDPLTLFYQQPAVLEEWFVSEDGSKFQGEVWGCPGVCDGSPLTTSPVMGTGNHLLDKYVQTQSGVVFELGTSRGEREERMGGMAKLAQKAPYIAMAVAGSAAAFTVLSHHIQLELFVV